MTFFNVMADPLTHAWNPGKAFLNHFQELLVKYFLLNTPGENVKWLFGVVTLFFKVPS
jgi:hypothetical protein